MPHYCFWLVVTIMTISLGLAITIEEQADAVGSFGMELNSKKLSVVTVTIIVELAFLWRVQLLLLKELVVTCMHYLDFDHSFFHCLMAVADLLVTE